VARQCLVQRRLAYASDCCHPDRRQVASLGGAASPLYTRGSLVLQADAGLVWQCVPQHRGLRVLGFKTPPLIRCHRACGAAVFRGLPRRSSCRSRRKTDKRPADIFLSTIHYRSDRRAHIFSARRPAYRASSAPEFAPLPAYDSGNRNRLTLGISSECIAGVMSRMTFAPRGVPAA